MLTQTKVRIAEKLYELGLRHMQPIASDLIFETAFGTLVRFVEEGRLDQTLFEGAEGAMAEFEINQLYVWYKSVYPDLLSAVDDASQIDQIWQAEQKQLKRLVEIRGWLQ